MKQLRAVGRQHGRTHREVEVPGVQAADVSIATRGEGPVVQARQDSEGFQKLDRTRGMN